MTRALSGWEGLQGTLRGVLLAGALAWLSGVADAQAQMIGTAMVAGAMHEVAATSRLGAWFAWVAGVEAPEADAARTSSQIRCAVARGREADRSTGRTIVPPLGECAESPSTDARSPGVRSPEHDPVIPRGHGAVPDDETGRRPMPLLMVAFAAGSAAGRSVTRSSIAMRVGVRATRRIASIAVCNGPGLLLIGVSLLVATRITGLLLEAVFLLVASAA